MYCGFAASNTFKGKCKLFLLPRILIVVLSILIVPTVKCRYTLEEINKLGFENDFESKCTNDNKKGMAYQTKFPIDTNHIGLKGILKQGLKGNVGARMKAHPVKSAWGLVKLINPIGVFILLGVGAALIVKNKKAN